VICIHLLQSKNLCFILYVVFVVEICALIGFQIVTLGVLLVPKTVPDHHG
jgi:hypothetical protein